MKELTREEKLIKERFTELYSYGNSAKVLTEDNKMNQSTLIEYKSAGDGKLYGIVKENQDYFIKTATKFEGRKPSAEDFVYIGGLQNKSKFKYDRLNETQKILNSKLTTINEAYGFVGEDVIPAEEEQSNKVPSAVDAPMPSPEGQAPMPSPEGQAPEGGEAPMPSPEAQAPMPSPEGGEAPMGDDMGSPEGGQDDSDPINKVKSHIGKAGNYLKNTPDVTSEMTKQLVNMLIGYIDVNIMSPEDKQEIIDKLNNEEIEEEVDIQKMDDDIDMGLQENKKRNKNNLNEEIVPDAQTIGAIISGVGAIFGGAYGIDKMMDYLKKRNPDVARKIEQLGKAAGDSIARGSEKFKESKEVGSDKLIKEYALKYNVSEKTITNTVHKFLKEEKEQTLKENKERRLRLTIKNIIKEKMGIKKKVLKEGTESKTRQKLEKQVDRYLESINKKK